jgi:hypothetical protein
MSNNTEEHGLKGLKIKEERPCVSKSIGLRHTIIISLLICYWITYHSKSKYVFISPTKIWGMLGKEFIYSHNKNAWPHCSEKESTSCEMKCKTYLNH